MRCRDQRSRQGHKDHDQQRRPKRVPVGHRERLELEIQLAALCCRRCRTKLARQVDELETSSKNERDVARSVDSEGTMSCAWNAREDYKGCDNDVMDDMRAILFSWLETDGCHG